MKLKEPELKVALKKLDKLISEIPDERRFLFHYKNFIVSFLRLKTTSVQLPTAEVMAVIKLRKPTIFYILKKEFSDNLIINIVTNIDMNYEEGLKRLDELKEKL